mgnify:FL=1
MRFTFFIIIFLFISCTSNINKIDNEELKLDEKLASDLIQLSINCVDKKFPYKVGYRYIDSTWIRPHYKLTPSFYGCWDWHSAVHGHWSMVKILKEFPNIKEAGNIREKIRKNLSKNNLEKEFQFFQNDFAKGFERTYGWAWLMLLYSELETWDDIEAKNWSKNLKPLVDLLSERTIIFLNKLSKPLRPGTHANTAFSFSLMYEYAQKTNNEKLSNKIKEYSIKHFSYDKNCPVNYEPSGTDFLSPCLAEASLMSKILSEREFNKWLSKFFPSFKEKSFGNIITPPEVLDPKDPGIGHLIGLMFHRAWTLNDVANKIQNDDKKLFLYKISKNHTKKGFELMFDSGYGGEHWLATFAIYNFTR